MKKRLTYLFHLAPLRVGVLIFSFSSLHLAAQQLIIDSTRFITGYECCTVIEYAMPTTDKGVLFVGYDRGNPLGIIPPFPLDTTYENVFIGKIDSNQNISWLKVYGGSNYDYAWSACQTPDGGYAVLATTESDDGDVANLIGQQDLWLLRLDASGNLLWQKTYGSTTGGSEATSIANTSDNGFIMLGTTDGSDVDVPFHYGGYFSLDWLVIKTDSLGNKQWSKDLGGTGDEQYYGSILSTYEGYYLISSTNSTDHDCTDTTWHPGVNTGDDYYVLKLDTAGNVLWDSSYGGTGDDIIYNAVLDTNDSSIVITGSGGSTDYIETDQHGEGDMLTLKINKNGTLVWHKSLGGPSWDVGTGITCSHNNGYIVYGRTFSYPDTMMGDIGLYDCWLFDIDSGGNIITNKIFGGTNYDEPSSIVSYLNGYVATGVSGSLVFTEGTTSGDSSNGGAFVSYINFWPLSTPAITNDNGKLIVYPDPAQNEITMEVSPSSGESRREVSIYDMLGRSVYTGEMKNEKQTIDVCNLPNGSYLLQTTASDGSRAVQKIIIEK